MNKQKQLDDLKSQALNDNYLPLKKGATNLVFGVGNPESEVLFLGEGPGYWEDMKAEPFVGNAGQLLNKALIAINLKREDVYITNVVMHRPPENRDPLPEELNTYQKYVDGIIEIIDPDLIITLGRFSMSKFLPNVFISGVHGKEFEVDINGKKITIYPMYHPAAALRNGDVMAKFKEDFMRIPDILMKIKNTKTVNIDTKEKEEQMKLL